MNDLARCENCGTKTIDRCLRCGAPQCCPRCCEVELLRSRLSEAETLLYEQERGRPQWEEDLLREGYDVGWWHGANFYTSPGDTPHKHDRLKEWLQARKVKAQQ